jgi:hypothetical protein
MVYACFQAVMMMTTSRDLILATWTGVPLSMRLVALVLLLIVGVMAIRVAPLLMGRSYSVNRDQPTDHPSSGDGATGADRETVIHGYGSPAWRRVPVGGGDTHGVRPHP